MSFTKCHLFYITAKNQYYMICRYCKCNCIKKRKRSNGKQKFRCKTCKKYQQSSYTKIGISKEKYKWVHVLNNEGNCLSGIGRLLHISTSSVQRVIERLVASLTKPMINETGESYEMDELASFCGNKENRIWLIYAINRRTREIIDFFVGRRTSENIKKVLSCIEKLNPKHIYTDRLNIYESLISKDSHKIYPRCTNYIERKNLTLRMWLKRLSRKQYALQGRRRCCGIVCICL